MSNKHLFETKVRSIKHYTEEIKRLKEAVKINEEVRAETEKSLIEFFPFQKGDVLFKGNKMIKINRVDSAYLGGDQEVIYKVYYHNQDIRDGFEETTDYGNWPLSTWNGFKKIN